MHRAARHSLLLLLMALLPGCSFHPGVAPNHACSILNEAPIAQVSSTGVEKVLEDPGIITVHHGFACASSNKDGTEDVLRVRQNLGTAGYARAAVFLNGWHLKYLNGEHKLSGVATMIRDIVVDRERIAWEAAGVLSDKNFDDGYEWCYYFTVLAWNPSALDLSVNQGDGECSEAPQVGAGNYFYSLNDNTTTALSSFARSLEDPQFASSNAVAVLPRGFGYMWGHFSTGPPNHNLLQLAYHLDHSERFMEKGRRYYRGPSSAVRTDESAFGGDSASWKSSAILKDDDLRRTYGFGEIVSGMSGADVAIVEPPFAILPIEDPGFFSACLPLEPSATYDIRIDNLSYKYVIPMLTGWNLGYGCGDRKIEEIGVRIEQILYDPVNPGTLRYKVSTAPEAGHNVTLLALAPVSPRLRGAK